MTFREDSARSRGGFQRDPSSDATPPRPDPTRRETIRKEHPSSLTDRIYNAQGGRPFAFTPMPPNATPAQECAIWIYDDLRLDEAGF